jgi:hypothetical protein
MRTANHTSSYSRMPILACCSLVAMLGCTRVAEASCDNRPGTPTNVSAPTVGPNSITFSWRNTTGRTLQEPRMFFDMYMRDGAGNSTGMDLTGTGPYNVRYGSTSTKTFNNLRPNTKYCFSLRARTAGGTQGCISAVTSNVACATTPPSGSATVSTGPVDTGVGSPIVLQARGMPGNVIVITGRGFRPNTAVTIRVTDQTLRSLFFQTNNGHRITASGSGTLNETFRGVCQLPGILYFAAQDGRSNPSDRTGTLWSNTPTINCT